MNDFCAESKSSDETLPANATTVNETTHDLLISVFKGVVGTAPIVGPVMAELFSQAVPNQRMDRMARFCKELDTRIQKIESHHGLFDLSDSDRVFLLEKVVQKAADASSQQRLRNLAALLVNGLSGEKVDIDREVYVLSMLDQLTDSEVVWLRFYLDPTARDKLFREKHASVLDPKPMVMGRSEAELEEAAISKSYKENLLRLGLLKHSRNGKNIQITQLGRVLLKTIEFEL